MSATPARRSTRPSVDTQPRRGELAAAMNQAAREHSTATVLFHSAMNAQFGLSATEGKSMDLLARLGPLTAGQLGHQTGLAPASVTELIDRLERRGLVRRGRDERDRRRVLVELVPEGVAEISAAFDRFGESIGALWDGYTPDELAVIRRFLADAAERLRAETARLAGNSRPAPRRRQPG